MTATAATGDGTAASPWVLQTPSLASKFLAFSKARGNDLSTPMPGYGFAGLKPGDRWCLCAARWEEARSAGMAPKVLLEATHIAALEVCSLDDLKAHAVEA